MTNNFAPDTTLSTNDPGDDIQRRFWYQAAVAAYYSLSIFYEDQQIEEILCEQHEDILLKKANGKFIGVQVKTREEGLDLFDATDDAIISTLAKFVKLEVEFPNYFEEFVITTNYSFYKAKETNRNIYFLLKLINDGYPDENEHQQRVLKKFIKLLEDKTNASSDQIISTLKKVRLVEYPKFNSIEIDLIDVVKNTFNLGNSSYIELSTIAKKIINTMLDASRIKVDNCKYYFLHLADDFEKENRLHLISGKRITRDMINNIIDSVTSNEIVLLRQNTLSISQMPKGYRILEKKMAAGGINIDNIDLAKNHKYQMEAMAARWLEKDYDKAQQKYDQLYNIVLTECREAYDEEYHEEGPFGSSMLLSLRKRLRQRWVNDRSLLFESTYEHLCGMAGVLTEECSVWWSDKFNIGEDE